MSAAGGDGSTGAGLLVAFEGLDGCGKGTQIERCAEWLRARAPARTVRVLRERGGTELGERVRELLLHGGPISPRAEMLLYMAARAELYAREVLPALERGEAVLLDRSHYSTAAYQGHGLGLSVEGILDLARAATRDRAPNRVVLLDLEPAQAAARLAARAGAGPDRIERRDPDYFRRVAEGFRDLARREPARFRVVPAVGSPDEVAARVKEALDDVA